MNKKKDTIKTNRKIIRKIEQIQVKNSIGVFKYKLDTPRENSNLEYRAK